MPQDSAILPGYIPIGIRSNHMDMARFVSADDPGFISVCGELRRWIKQMDTTKGNLPSSNRTKDLQGEGAEPTSSTARCV